MSMKAKITENLNGNSNSGDEKIIQVLKDLGKEFDNVESFVEVDESKSERFKEYLKKLYDYLKIQDDELTGSTAQTLKSTNQYSLPELIVDKSLVDNEQIYQQLQLYNNDQTTTNINSMTKFFSKCLVNIDNLSFNIDFKAIKKNGSLNNGNHNGTTTDNLDTNDDADKEREYDDDNEYSDEEDDDDNGSINSDDSIDNLIKNKLKSSLKKDTKSEKKKADESNYGIPDGSDSEISDFEVDENGENDDEDDEEELEDEDDLEDDDDEDEDEDNTDNEEPKNKNSKKKLSDMLLEDVDSDEVDEDLVDLYKDLGDEKEVLEIGKPAKAFDQIDFDREDFDLVDQDLNEEEVEERNGASNQKNLKSSKKESKAKKVLDLFDLNSNGDAANGVDGKKANENDTEAKSSFEIRQEKVKQNIDEIHSSMLNGITDKPWQLKGEVTAHTRPQDSLLEEYLQFDHTTRQAPVINMNTTEEIEKMIKQRIKDKSFDDVERKVKPVEMQYQFKKQVVLDQEKSKVGLGDIYEQDFLKQQEKMNSTGQLEAGSSKDAESNPKHDEIRKLMQNLFIKLDALSNFHYTPKAPMPELKVVSNMPTIAMEEVAPVTVAETSMLAPEEIKAKINTLPKSKSEEDKSDKKRKLRAKKIKNKTIKAKKEKRLQLAQSLDPDNAKINKKVAMGKLEKQAKNMSKNIKILKTDKKTKVNSAYRSSSAFFKQLQENTQVDKNVVKKKKINESDSTKSSKKFKL